MSLTTSIDQIFSHTQLDDFDFINGIRNGYGTINYRIFGFWSHSSISINVGRSWNDGEWNINISSSSGGRDTNEVENDMDAYRNFAAALNDACDVAKTISENIQMYNEMYNKVRQDLKLQHLEELRLRQEKIDSDPAIGMDYANSIVCMMEDKSEIIAEIVERGSDDSKKITLSVNRRGRRVYRCGDTHKLDREGMVRYLSAMSVRSTFQLFQNTVDNT